MDSKRMHAAGKLAGEGFIDHAVALDPALSPEGFRHDIKTEMSLAAGAMSGVAFMLIRFVLDAKALWCESVAQLFGDEILPSHGLIYDARFCCLSSLEGLINALA
jgi:hypothetical protein